MSTNEGLQWVPDKIDEIQRWRQRKDIQDALLEQQVKNLGMDLTVVKDSQKEAILESRNDHKQVMAELAEIKRIDAQKAGEKSFKEWATPVMLGLLAAFLALKEAGAFG